MADPMTVMGIQAVTTLAGGLAAKSQARAERDHANNNAFIGRTRAIQTGAAGMDQLQSELATLRTTMKANGQRDGGVMAAGLTRVRDRERRIETGNRMQESYDQRHEGRMAMSRGRAAFISSIGQAAPSMFNMYSYSRGPQ